MYSRTIRAEGVDAEHGTFEMTLATEGEATDGHILSIKGGTVPDRMPLLVSHFNDPASAAGSVIGARKETKSTPPRLRAVGMIELGGEGTPAEIRRDILHMIERGHLGAVSIRWDSDPGDSVMRVNLPSDHPHFVDAQEEPEGSPRRWGQYFEKWRAMEGSIVAVGSDPGALIGRAEELEAEGASAERVAFCRALAGDAHDALDPQTIDIQAVHERVAAGALAEKLDDELALLVEGDTEFALDALRLAVDVASDAGAEPADILNAVANIATDGLRAVEFEIVTDTGTSTGNVFLPEAAADEVEELREAQALDTPAVTDPGGIEDAVQDPPVVRESVEPFDPIKVVRAFSEEMDARDRRLRQSFVEILAEATGKVLP